MNIKYLFTNKYRIVGGTAALRISVPRNRNCAEDPDPQSNAYGIQPDPDSQNIYYLPYLQFYKEIPAWWGSPAPTCTKNSNYFSQKIRNFL